MRRTRRGTTRSACPSRVAWVSVRECHPTASWSGAPSRYTQSVPIRIFKIALAAGKTFFIDGNPELV